MALFSRTPKPVSPARHLYDAIVSRAREQVFHTNFAVADSLDGRFDLLTLHAFAVMDALKPLGPAGGKVGTEFANVIFAGFEDALRQLGVSDMGLGRRIKAMANAFYGRLEAYGSASGEPELAAALLRNLYRGEETMRRESEVLAHYISELQLRLRAHSEHLLEGRVDFGPLPVM